MYFSTRMSKNWVRGIPDILAAFEAVISLLKIQGLRNAYVAAVVSAAQESKS